MNSECKKPGLGLGVCIALGLIVSALILSLAAYRIAGSRQSVMVKGLAEKTLSADHARWQVRVEGSGKTLQEAFVQLRANRPLVEAFFVEHGFPAETQQADREYFNVMYKQDKDGRRTNEIDFYNATQLLSVNSSDVKLVEKTAAQIISLQEKGLPLHVADPEFLVSTLEQVKMSLISDATKNAFDRANEFAKTGNAKVGAMKSASQGAFYILPAQGDGGNNDYGGVYDKSTIDKVARVVVTIEYGLTE